MVPTAALAKNYEQLLSLQAELTGAYLRAVALRSPPASLTDLKFLLDAVDDQIKAVGEVVALLRAD